MPPALRALVRAVPAAVIVGLLLVPPPTARAVDELLVSTSAHYALLPDEGRVRVTIDAVATSRTPDGPDVRYFYTGMTLVVHPGATSLAAASGGVGLRTTVVESSDAYTAVEVTFGRGVYYGESYPFRLTYDLVDPGGAPERDLRIRRSFAAFGVWAFGSDESTDNRVEVQVPAGYDVTLAVGAMHKTTTGDGSTLLSAEAIARPFEFFAYVTAEGRNAWAETMLEIPVGDAVAQVQLLGWDDDPDWTDRMRTLLESGLPELAAAIGLPYPIPGRLTVTENALTRLGNYAGFFDERIDTIAVRYDVDPFVGLHEAAHIWFNGSLFADRWIGEAFASFYAEEVGRRTGVEAHGFELTPDLEGHRLPLNAWGAPGTESLETEDFAYAATNELGRQIADLATLEGLQLVWRAAANRELAYQPVDATDPERNEARVAKGWQELLDLLEERTDAGYVEIWRDWIVTADEAPALDERGAARDVYTDTLAAADDWELPRSIRLLMSSWQFDDATARLEQARAVLEQRDAIDREATGLELEAPDTLRTAFEGNHGLGTAANEAGRLLATLSAIQAADAAVGREPTLLEWIGLAGSDPQASLGEARAAFEEGELDVSGDAAASAIALRAGAAGQGRERVLLVGGGILVLDAGYLAWRATRGRRQRVVSAAG